MSVNLLLTKDKIKKELLEKAAKIWNITDLNYMDPMVSLLVDSLSYELSKVGQSITSFNSKVLEELASIIVPGERLTAAPAHAILKVLPMEPDVVLTPQNQFYIPNGLKAVSYGKVQGDLYFSSIEDTPLINAQVKWMVQNKETYQIEEGVYKEKLFSTSFADKRIPDNEIWLGIEPDIHTQTIDKIRFFLDIDSSIDIEHQLRFNSEVKFEIVKPNGETIPFQNRRKADEEESFNHNDPLTKLLDIYGNKFLPRELSKEQKKVRITPEVLTKHPDFFKELFNSESLEFFDVPCFWIKVTFPEIYDRETLDKVKLFLNCFVIANKRITKSYHDLNRSGTILPLETLTGEELLLVGEISDQNDYEFTPLFEIKNTTDKTGTYKVYYGRMESFDLRNGRLMLEEMTYKVREEGNAFSAMAQDTILVHLEELYEDLEVLENKLTRLKTNYESTFNSYIIISPKKGTEWLEYEYWTTNCELANNLPVGTELQQYRFANLLHPNSIRFLTPSLGGRATTQGKEKVAALRELVLGKDRLVSSSDIKTFITKEFGQFIKKINIKPGYKIFPDKKKGIIRVTEIQISPKNNAYNKGQWKTICSGLESQIRKLAVRGEHYYVMLDPSTKTPNENN